MKFYNTPYHSNLIKDNDRLAVFNEGIKDYYKNYKNNKDYIDYKDYKGNENDLIAFDIGCGSGILSYFASKYFHSIIAIDSDKQIIDCAKRSFKEKGISNVSFINEDASSFEVDISADLIICEMLDTALIDEEEVRVLNHIRKYLKDGGKIIPQGVINIAEPVFMEKDHIHYEDEDFHDKKPNYKVLGESVTYSVIDFSKNIVPEFKTTIDFTLKKISDCESNGFKLNGIKLTTFTKINENLICGPTPMLNPPLFIPINIENYTNDSFSGVNELELSVELEYIMGGGIKTIKATLL
jgi:predicted RNA methylase